MEISFWFITPNISISKGKDVVKKKSARSGKLQALNQIHKGLVLRRLVVQCGFYKTFKQRMRFVWTRL